MSILKAIIAITIALLIAVTNAIAGDIPELSADISLVSKDQDINLFLDELFSQINIPVVIAPQVEGTINSAFINESAQQILDKVSRTFGLLAYYDGVAVYIYEDNGLNRKVVPVNAGVAERVVRNASDLGLTDKKNTLKVMENGSLIITGVERFFEQVDELVKVTRAPARPKQKPTTKDSALGFKVFYLKYAWAEDVTLTLGGREVVIPGVASTLRAMVPGGGAGEFLGSAGSVKQLPATLPKLKGEGLAAVGETDQNEPAQQPASQQVYAPEGNDSEVRIAADGRLNAIIMRDTADKIAQYETLIEALDVEPEMVEIEATIIDVNIDRLRELGIDWSAQRNRFSSVAAGTQAEAGFSSDVGGFVSYMTGNRGKFIGQINALERQGAANVISSPHILTLSNVEAIFDTSSTFFVRVAGREEVDLFNVSAGTALRVTPHVFTDNNETKIKLLVTVEDGKQDDQQVDDIPTVTRSVINTQALIGPEESMLIGGLVRESNTRAEDGVPGLSRIPLLGNLFKSKASRVERIERMFLISPKLSSDYKQADNKLQLHRDEQLGKALNGEYGPGSQELVSLEPVSLKTRPAPAAHDTIASAGVRAKAALKNRESHNIEPLREVAAQYPTAALLEKTEGQCRLEFTITKNGKTSDIEVVSCTHPMFAATSKQAISRFEYAPQQKNGESIAVPGQSKTFVYEIN